MLMLRYTYKGISSNILIQKCSTSTVFWRFAIFFTPPVLNSLLQNLDVCIPQIKPPFKPLFKLPKLSFEKKMAYNLEYQNSREKLCGDIEDVHSRATYL